MTSVLETSACDLPALSFYISQRIHNRYKKLTVSDHLPWASSIVWISIIFFFYMLNVCCSALTTTLPPANSSSSRYYECLRTGRSRRRISSPDKVKNFHFSSTVHPTSYPMRTGGFSPGVKRQEREADHSPTTSAKIKIVWVHKSTPPYAFTA
jgi:hypothetical protein